MARLCFIYGGFISLLAGIPNPPTGRLAFLFCGGVMLVVGSALHRASKGKYVATPATDKGRPSPSPHLATPAATTET
jgi:hypothetical protein